MRACEGVRGGRLGLTEEDDARQARASQRVAQQRLLVRSPTGRMGHSDGVRNRALTLGDPVDHPADHGSGDRLRAVALTADHQWDRVTETTLELADHTVRMADRASLGGITDQ